MIKHKNKMLLLALAAVVVLGGVFALFQWQGSSKVTSVISLDVNPSIELEVNKKERIISANPLNEDAEKVLEGMDLEGSTLTVGMKAILGSLLEHGYLDTPSSAILISVEDEDSHRAAYLQNTLTDTADSALKNASSDASVLSQVVPVDEDLKKEAHSHSISVGKANYIRKIGEQNSDLDYAQLADLTAQELSQLLENGASSMPIGRDAARKAALAASKLPESDLLSWEVDPELDDSMPHYEVEFTTPSGVYTYRVDAYTGEVYQGSSAPAAPSDPQTPNTKITKDKAIDIALDHAKVPYTRAEGLYCKLDWDDGIQKYDVKFYVGNMEYDYDIDANTGAVLKSEKEQNNNIPSSQNSNTKITKDKAIDIALKHAGVSESAAQGLYCKLDWDDGIQNYDIEFYVGNIEYSYEIDAKTGTILKAEKDQDNDYVPAPQQSGSGALIGEASAKSTALNHAGVSKSSAQGLICKLDWDDGIQKYEIEFHVGATEYDYEIDAKTGTILKSERDIDD